MDSPITRSREHHFVQEQYLHDSIAVLLSPMKKEESEKVVSSQNTPDTLTLPLDSSAPSCRRMPATGQNFEDVSVPQSERKDEGKRRQLLDDTTYDYECSLNDVSSPGTRQRGAPRRRNRGRPPKIIPPLPFDPPPACPRRSVDAGFRNATSKSTAYATGHSLLPLSRSEHETTVLSRAARLRRLCGDDECKDSPIELQGKQRPSLNDSRQGSGRDIVLRPPRRQKSGELDLASKSDHELSSRRAITLRAPGNQVLLGSRELSRTEHLTRRCPRRNSIDSSSTGTCSDDEERIACLQ